MSIEKDLYRFYKTSDERASKITAFYILLHYTDSDCITGPKNNKYFKYEAFSKKYTQSNTNERKELNALLQNAKDIRDKTTHNLIDEIVDCDYFRYYDLNGNPIKIDIIQFIDNFINMHLIDKIK